MPFLRRKLNGLLTYKNENFVTEEAIKLNQVANNYLIISFSWSVFFAAILTTLNIYLLNTEPERYRHVFYAFSPIVTALCLVNPIFFLLRFRFKDTLLPLVFHNVFMVLCLCVFAILTGDSIITYLLPTALVHVPFFFLPRSYKRTLAAVTIVNLTVIASSLVLVFSNAFTVVTPKYINGWANPAVVVAMALMYIHAAYIARAAEHQHADLLADARGELEKAYDKIKSRDEKMQHELDFAADIQKSLIPHSFTSLEEFTVYFDTIPYGKVTGDYFDIVHNEHGTYFIMADASGHGVPAALVTVIAKQAFHDALADNKLPGEILHAINLTLAHAITTNDYLTAFLILVEPGGTMHYTQAGHPKPVYIQAASKECSILETDGLAVGVVTELPMPFESKQLQLAKGDRLVLFTDGISEQKNNSGEELGPDQFYGWVNELQLENPADFHKALVDKWFAYVGSGKEYDDDVSLATVEYTGS